MKKKIVISNVYGKYNLGDQAIRNSGLKLLSEIYPGSDFYLLCESVNNFPLKTPKNIKTHLQYAPYGYAMDTEGKPIKLAKKLILLLSIVLGTFALLIVSKIMPSLLPSKGFFSYVHLIKSADTIFLMGGGYLVTKHPAKDFFGIILNSLPLYVAKYFKKNIIVLPISFGPFAHSLHESIIGRAIRNSTVFCRDEISLSYARKHNPKATYYPDLALYEWRKYEN